MIFTNLKWMMMIIIIIIKIIIITVKVKSRMLSRMKNKYKMKKLDHLTPLTQLKDTLKQKIQLKAQSMRRYENKVLRTEKHV